LKTHPHPDLWSTDMTGPYIRYECAAGNLRNAFAPGSRPSRSHKGHRAPGPLPVTRAATTDGPDKPQRLLPPRARPKLRCRRRSSASEVGEQLRGGVQELTTIAS